MVMGRVNYFAVMDVTKTRVCLKLFFRNSAGDKPLPMIDSAAVSLILFHVSLHQLVSSKILIFSGGCFLENLI